MSTKFSSITWERAESQVRRTAGVSYQDPPADHFREMANIFLSYIWRILDGKLDWAYRTAVPLVLKTDCDLIQKAQLSALEVSPAKALKYITTLTLELRTGDQVLMQGYSQAYGEIAGFRAVVVEGGYTGILGNVQINGADQNYVPTLDDWAGGAALLVMHSLAKKVADLSTLSMKHIVGVYDTPGGNQRIWEVVADFQRFRGLVEDRAYDDQIACYLRGDILEVYEGPEAATIDTPMIELDGVPELYTRATRTNEIQLFTEYYNMWFDLMVGWTLDWVNRQKDPALEARINEHLELLNASMAEA